MTFLIPQNLQPKHVLITTNGGREAISEGGRIAGYNDALREIDTPAGSVTAIQLRATTAAGQALAGMKHYLPNIIEDEAAFVAQYSSGWAEGYQFALTEQGIPLGPSNG
jgi:hypothetical protein